jgi:hypothetical protein
MSYVESVRTKMAEISAQNQRSEQIGESIMALIRDHVCLNTDEDVPHLTTPQTYWNADQPAEMAWFNLYDKDGKLLAARHLDDEDESRPFAVKRAEFIVAPEWNIFGTVFSAEINRESQDGMTLYGPKIVGLRDEELSSAQLDGVIVDINRYTMAVTEGQIA